MSLTEVFPTKIRLSYTGLGHPNDRFKSYRTLSVGVWALPSGRVESKKVCYQQGYPVQFCRTLDQTKIKIKSNQKSGEAL